jgi:hypothetical protein
MKKLFIPAIAMLMLVVASCNKPAPAVATTQGPPIDSLGDKNKEIVKGYMDAILTGNSTAMGGFLADNFLSRGPGIKDSANKEKSMANWKKSWDEEFKSIKYDEIAVLAKSVPAGPGVRNAGDWVLKWGTVTVEYKNGMPSATFNLHLATRVDNGKIAFTIDYYNVWDILSQQGFTLTPPAKKAKK